MARKISELGLAIPGTRVETMVEQLYAELAAKGLAFRPPVYLSDQWGCPDGTPLIGVPFYLADPRLARIEDDLALGVESDDESMRYLRHEAGHAFNYAYRLYDRPDWRQIFGPYSRPYRERYRADPFSRDFVRHILGWYAQKHPDEDFAETFAVWLTPGLRLARGVRRVAGARKARVRRSRDAAKSATSYPQLSSRPKTICRWRRCSYTVAEHYRDSDDTIPIRDERLFDGDLRNIFASPTDAPERSAGRRVHRAHRREIVGAHLVLDRREQLRRAAVHRFSPRARGDARVFACAASRRRR